MPKPIEVTVLRAWDGMVITAWWDEPTLPGALPGETKENKAVWFNIRQFKSVESGTVVEKTIRLTVGEVETLIKVIRHGNQKVANA